MSSLAQTPQILEDRAAEQRRQLHNSVTELKSRLRHRLDIKRNARRYLWAASSTVAAVGLLLGYGLARFISRK